MLKINDFFCTKWNFVAFLLWAERRREKLCFHHRNGKLLANRGAVCQVMWSDSFFSFSPRVAFKLHLQQSDLLLYKCLQWHKGRCTHKAELTLYGVGEAHWKVVSMDCNVGILTAVFLLLVTWRHFSGTVYWLLAVCKTQWNLLCPI